jgi:hypothetical protein
LTFKFRNLDRLGGKVTVRVDPDEDGFIGRECPVEVCLGYFKVRPGTGLTGPDLKCVCPYCGHEASNDHFWTQDQLAYAKSMVMREVSGAIHRDLKSLEFSSPARGAFGIGLSLKVKSGSQPPIHRYREQALETELTCEFCSLEYAVFGLFAHCPDCGKHNSTGILAANLDLVRKQVALAIEQSDSRLGRHLLEDALENCVSTFDGFGRELCRVSPTPSGAAAPTVSFQNLERAESRLRQLFSVELRSTISDLDWHFLKTIFMRRHLLSHRAGVVDEQYLTETRDPDAQLGRRISVEPGDIERAAAIIRTIAKALYDSLRPAATDTPATDTEKPTS